MSTSVFEARLVQGQILKKLVDSVKDLVTDANLECSAQGIHLQAMDSSHVALVALLLRADGFEHYSASRNVSLGVNLSSMAKILKCSSGDDIITLRAREGSDNLTFLFESPKQTRISDFDLKLMDIDTEHLGIPETDYKCVISMPSAEFKSICSDLSIISESVTISASKEGVRFSVAGGMGSGNVVLRQNSGADKDGGVATVIELTEEVSLQFALRYLNMFCKGANLSDTVTLAQDVARRPARRRV